MIINQEINIEAQNDIRQFLFIPGILSLVQIAFSINKIRIDELEL